MSTISGMDASTHILDAQAITAALGGKWHTHNGYARCPVHDDGRASLSIRNGRNGGVIVHCFAGCEWKLVADELRGRGLWPDRPAAPQRPYEAPKPPGLHAFSTDELKRAADARVMLDFGEPAAGTVVETYLRARGITIPVPTDIRFDGGGSMVALVRQLDGTVTAYQRTRLRPDGSDRERHQWAKLTRGVLGTGAVRLAEVEPDVLGLDDGVELGVAEGVETGLSAMQIFHVPVWVALGDRFNRIAIPEQVTKLIIFADHGEAGVKAADKVRKLYRGTPIKVEVRFPLDGHKDFNDQLRAMSAGRAA
jgi:hypothetical protein